MKHGDCDMCGGMGAMPNWLLKDGGIIIKGISGKVLWHRENPGKSITDESVHTWTTNCDYCKFFERSIKEPA